MCVGVVNVANAKIENGTAILSLGGRCVEPISTPGLCRVGSCRLWPILLSLVSDKK